MTVRLDHTAVFAEDRHTAAQFLTELFDLPAPVPAGPFLAVPLGNGVTLDYIQADGPVSSQHYAFLVTEAEFDAIMARIERLRLDYWADPHQRQPGEINTNFGGRGVYFADPSGHWLEVITRTYG
ncbi:VOC family protein [Actinokineospora sp.]|uniref:VOC family protein n=1 Tax=Actinokineospora sp. TaxID=1872133 RepID=UPI00403824BB